MIFWLRLLRGPSLLRSVDAKLPCGYDFGVVSSVGVDVEDPEARVAVIVGAEGRCFAYVVAYSLSGVTADLVGKATGKGVGTGSSITIIGAGICLVIVALIMSRIKKIRELENTDEPVAVQVETA